MGMSKTVREPLLKRDLMPTPTQESVLNDPNLRVIVGAARRTGKELMAILKIVRYPGDYLIVVPDFNAINAFERKLMDLVSCKRVVSNWGYTEVQLGYSDIHIASASTVAVSHFARGRRFDKVILLEFAYVSRPIQEKVLEQVEPTILLSEDRQIIIITTPPKRPEKGAPDNLTTLIWHNHKGKFPGWSRHTIPIPDPVPVDLFPAEYIGSEVYGEFPEAPKEEEVAPV